MEKKWCAVCGSRHDLGPTCPGEILTTGTERFGWKIAVEAGIRAEEYSVLIGPAQDVWRARIVTLPNMLWSIPRGRATMKFVGRSEADAEARAKNYILEVCRKRGYKKTKLIQAGKVETVQPDGTSCIAGDDRHLHEIKVRFGEERPERNGKTGDMSMKGLSIVTEQPFPEGRRLKIVLYMNGATLPLQGSVIWTRTTSEDGCEPGMGVQLHSPPALYRHYVKKLTGAEIDEPEVAPALPAAQLTTDG